MLSSRTKIIILVIGVVVIAGLVVLALKDFSPKKEAAGPKTEGPEVDLSFLEERETVIGQEFDASNKEAFAQAMGEASASETISPLEQEARSLAIFFTERFGTYSSDANFANIDDLRSFMTPSMQRWSERYKQSQPWPSGFSSMITEVASLSTKSFAPEKRRAVFDIITNRTESNNGKDETYQQKASLELAQENSGAWLVASLYWGERL